MIHLPRSVTVGDTTFIVSTTVEIGLKAGELVHSFEQEAINIAYERKVTTTKIDATTELPWWYWLLLTFVALVGVWLGKKM